MEPHDFIDGDRYELVHRLGTGAMGEVWKARLVKFRIEEKFVAIKFLKEEGTHQADEENRRALERRLAREASDGLVDVDTALSFLTDLLETPESGISSVRREVLATLKERPGLPVAHVLGLFDQLVTNPDCCQNAADRHRLREMFEVEANSLVNLRHENIVTVSDYGSHQDRPFLVMDYVEGQTLDRLIQRGTLSDRRQQLALMEGLCAGLDYAHRQGLVHRDIKPANLIVEDGPADLSRRIRILDFGVAKKRRLSDNMTVAGATGLIGTLNYMSPEQIRREPVDRRSDIFAVGVVFYELLSGQKAFPSREGDYLDLARRISSEPPQPLRELVQDLESDVETILDRALEKNPDQRYQHLADMKRDLARVRQRLGGGTTIILDTDRLLRQAERALEVGNDRLALDTIAQILAWEPANPRALALREQVLRVQRERQAADALAQARAAAERGDLDAARDAWSRARDLLPDSADVLSMDQALAAAEAERRADENRRARRAELGPLIEAAIEAERADEAEPLLAELRSLEADDNTVQSLQSQLVDLQARLEARAAEADRLQQLERLASEAERARDSGDVELCARLLAEAADLAPERADLREEAERASREADVAVRERREKQEQETRLATLIRDCDRALESQDLEAAAAAIADALTLAPDRPDLLERAAVVDRRRRIAAGLSDVSALLASGDLNEARDRLEELLALDPDAPGLKDAGVEIEAALQARERERHEQEVATLLGEAGRLWDAGEQDQALDLLRSRQDLDARVVDRLRALTRSLHRQRWLQQRQAALTWVRQQARPLLAIASAGVLGLLLYSARGWLPVLDDGRVALAVELQPQAEVRIESLSGTSAPAAPLASPFEVDLEPGRYRLTVDRNPGTGRPFSFEVEASVDGPASIVRALPVAVTVNLLPWANVSIEGLEGATAPAESSVTPFSVDLLPGRYRLNASNGGVTPDGSFDLLVPIGQPVQLNEVMPDFNADDIVRRLIGPPR